MEENDENVDRTVLISRRRYVTKLEKDFSALRSALRERNPDGYERLLVQLDVERSLPESMEDPDDDGEADQDEVKSRIKNAIKDKDDMRAFRTDDIPFAILLAKWLGEQLDVTTPFVEEIFLYSQALRPAVAAPKGTSKGWGPLFKDDALGESEINHATVQAHISSRHLVRR